MYHSLELFDGTSTLGELFSKNFQPASLIGENKLFCQQCDAKVDGTMQTRWLNAPFILALQVKRVGYNSLLDAEEKDNRAIHYPLFLDAGRAMFGHNDEEACVHGYRLVAVLSHLGIARAGHYYMRYRIDDTRWYVANCTEGLGPVQGHCSQADALGDITSAYMFFYVHCPPSVE